MADVQAAAGSLAACPAASLLTAVALKLLNDSLVAEREVGTVRRRTCSSSNPRNSRHVA